MKGMTRLLAAGCIAVGVGAAAVAGASATDSTQARSTAAGPASSTSAGQTPSTGAGQAGSTIDAHVAAARKAVGREHTGLFDRICTPEAIRPPQAAPRPAPESARGAGGRGTTAPAPAARVTPPRSQWYHEPVKVFDNLYFVGQSEYSAWAVTTSDGIIVIDTLFDYSVEEEVANGLKKLGLDPAQIKYVIVSHGHGDHSGGAKFLQDTFRARVIMSAADWDLVSRSTRDPAPRKDMVATDGMKLTLGDTTLTLYITPGHTPGTISTLVPVKDGGRPHLMAEWGGTAFNFARSRAAFQTYIDSAARFRDIVTKAGADGLIANHLNFDGSKTKLPALAKRRPGDPHPYVIGNDAVRRYLTIAEECAKAAQAALPQ
jgi:metallo-beta-lactamase class B